MEEFDYSQVFCPDCGGRLVVDVTYEITVPVDLAANGSYVEPDVAAKIEEGYEALITEELLYCPACGGHFPTVGECDADGVYRLRIDRRVLSRLQALDGRS
jgi:uncharacterized protein YbaR (Trm112 family)